MLMGKVVKMGVIFVRQARVAVSCIRTMIARERTRPLYERHINLAIPSLNRNSTEKLPHKRVLFAFTRTKGNII